MLLTHLDSPTCRSASLTQKQTCDLSQLVKELSLETTIDYCRTRLMTKGAKQYCLGDYVNGRRERISNTKKHEI